MCILGMDLLSSHELFSPTSCFLSHLLLVSTLRYAVFPLI